jgi:polyphosphate glucokinase
MNVPVANIDVTRHETAASSGAPYTLAVDIGGTNVKASVMDCTGLLVAAEIRVPTPKVATPRAIVDAVAGLAAQLPSMQRVSVGFPGVVRGLRVETAPNLGTEHWAGVPLGALLAERLGVPTRVLNDAAVQGLGVVQGPGLECVVTLGTGFGCALFRDRHLLLPLELGQHRARAGKTYDQYVGHAALVKKGLNRWNKRVRRVIRSVTTLTSCDVLYVGGGNARRIAFEPPPHVRIVNNLAGITGGIRLWERELDALFQDEARNEAPAPPVQGMEPA